MIQRHLKKLICMKICLIIICLYMMLLLHAGTSNEKTDNGIVMEPSSRIPATQKIQNNFVEELLARRIRIRNFCGNKTTIENSRVFKRNTAVFRRLYVDTKHNITWCPIFKAASSTIMRIFVALGGMLTQEIVWKVQKGKLQLNKLARDVFPSVGPQSQKAVLSTNRLIVVRHPFERLLSAYRDKLEHRENREYYYKKFGQSIVKTFGAPDKNVEPTFVEFLQYVANRRARTDEHWRPFYKECAPCEFDYHFVLKTESLNTELEQLFPKLGLRDYLPEKSVNINPQGHTNIEITQQYFSQVPRTLLESIYKSYQRDFELFGYSPDMYFNMTILK